MPRRFLWISQKRSHPGPTVSVARPGTAPNPKDCSPRTLTEQCSACCTLTPRIRSASSFRDGLPLCQGDHGTRCAGAGASAGAAPNAAPNPRDLHWKRRSSEVALRAGDSPVVQRGGPGRRLPPPPSRPGPSRSAPRRPCPRHRSGQTRLRTSDRWSGQSSEAEKPARYFPF